MTENVTSVITFDGEEEHWKLWSMRFMAKATITGYCSIMIGRNAVPDESTDLVTSSLAARKIRRMNEVGYCELLLAMKTERFMEIVSESRTTELPSGCLKTAWDNLKNVVEPNDVTSKITLTSQFANLKLKQGDNSDDWISKMEGMRRKLKDNYKTKISDEDFLIRLLQNIPKGTYNDLKISFRRQLVITVDPLTLESMKLQLRAYEQDLEGENENEVEESMYTSQFKGQCGICGKYGHHRVNCTSKLTCTSCGQSGHTQEKFWKYLQSKSCGRMVHEEKKCWKSMKCDKCGRTGHPTYRCWTNEEYEGNKPEWATRNCSYCGRLGHSVERCYKRINENKYEKENETNVKAFVCSEKICECKKEEETLTWIADSGASCHLTHSLKGLKNLKVLK